MSKNTTTTSEERSNAMTPESIEQLKARLKRQDEEKEEAFKKRLERAYADNAGWRAEQAQKKRLEEQERERLHAGVRESREQEMKASALRPWLDAGGTEEEFEQEWPQLRREMLKERALGGVSQERREAFKRNVRAF
jgi:guanylate kinase